MNAVLKQIDGAQGEGGGQILRSALALSMVTGTPMRIHNIRAGRSKPGLMRQHLTALRAAAEVCHAQVGGDAIGSQEVTFTPGAVAPGDYHFSIGTAGSTTLVLQTILPALLRGSQPSTIVLEGGTHNPFAPPFDFLVRTYLPVLARLGPSVTATLDRAGFYPAGGGQMTVRVEPVAQLAPVELLERSEIRRRTASATVANLPRAIAERELAVVQRKLNWPAECLSVVEVNQTPGPGNLVTLALELDSHCEVFTSFGVVDRPAESVANHAVQQCQRYLKSTAPVGEHLADQILLPLALAGAGSYRAICLSRHTSTHIEVVRSFLECPVNTRMLPDKSVQITVG